MSLKKPNFEKWLRLEIAHDSKGSTALTHDHDTSSYTARLLENNARKGEALCQLKETDPIQRVRNLIYRGELEQAELDIQNLDVDHPEVFLEKVRIASLRGKWLETTTLASEALLKENAITTQMSLYQIRALGYFEQGHFDNADRDLEKVLSLSTVLPFGNPQFFAEILRVKVLARTESLKEARFILGKLWNKALSSKDIKSIDQLLVLFRTEIDLKRIEQKPFVYEAVACALLAQKSGDQVYEALSMIDIANALQTPYPALINQIDKCKNRFERVRLLCNELEQSNKEPVSTTAKSLRDFTAKSELQQTKLSELLNCSSIIVPARHAVISLESTLTVKSEPTQIRLFEAAQLLSRGPIRKEEFFTAHWGLPYRQEQHDSLIRTLLSRIRVKLGITVNSTQGLITLEGSFCAQ